MNSTKDAILNYLIKLSDNFDFQQISYFSANSIAQDMHVSRSLASQYLNELVKEGHIFKISTRPVYFLHKKSIEMIFRTELNDIEFYNLDDFRSFIERNGKVESEFSKMVGYDKSLEPVMKQFKEVFEYPPYGLPLILHGEIGTGKRTMCDLIFKNSLAQGRISEKSRLIRIECTAHNSNEILTELFGDKNSKGSIDKQEAPVLMICNAQYMSAKLQNAISVILEKMHEQSMYQRKKGKLLRLLLLMSNAPMQSLNERLLRNIPVSIHVPSLVEKSSEEIEELIIFLIQQEAERMNQNIKVSNTVLRALIHTNYPMNVLGLKNAIQQMCAIAMRKFENGKDLVIHSYDLPEHSLQSLPILQGEEVVYIDVRKYVKSKEIDILLDYFDQILSNFQKSDVFEDYMKELEHTIRRFFDYLLYKQRNEFGQMKGLEISLHNIMDIALKTKFINIPSNFEFIIAKLIYFRNHYASSIEKWHDLHKQQLERLINLLKQNLLGETMIAEDITRLIESNLEIQVNDITIMIIIITLYRYNAQLGARKLFGLIIAHGYSTASSISDAVNTLIGSYVFESIDMPLDITIDQIKEILLERLQRMNNHADVVIMVDMGSLEQLGEGLSHIANRNIGVINNVSTKMALHIGFEILQGTDLETILKKTSENSKAEYTVVKQKQNDCIIFTSESGITTAKRMRQLFEMSFPMAIPVDYEICDYHQLISKGAIHPMIESRNVLFITGTANPHVKGQLFISLEGIISSNNIEMVRQGLSKYLKPDQMEVMVNALRKNFTLQNVVQYLTILNPKTLLDNVSMAIEMLQSKMHRKFGGKTLIGIYIHICCLIERLVTKTCIENIQNLEHFEKEHMDFLQFVKESTLYLTQHYNIEIPIYEIVYLYEFIEADEQQINGDFLMESEREELGDDEYK